MTGETGSWTLLPGALCIEPRPMGTHLERAQLGVALQAIPLRVTARARFQALARGLPVSKQPGGLGIVISRT
jgi:hypothetical protein